VEGAALVATDTVIVGGGFAGVTAARELTMRGRSAVLVEARDRLGGRTHTAFHDGRELELGGTWVHPAQPNVWAEITRYGLDVEELPEPGAVQSVWSAGRLAPLRRDDMKQLLEALVRFCAPAKSLYAMPYADRLGPDPQGYADRSVREVLGTLELAPIVRDTLDAVCSTLGHAPLDQVAASEIARSLALAGWSPTQMFAAVSGLKLVRGTRSLIDAIASQAELTVIRLSSAVRGVAQTHDGVRVDLVSGESVAARTALITVPINVLNHVTFEPKLSAIKRAAATQRHAGSGVKAFVRVAGDFGNISVFAPETEAINWVGTYHHGAEGSLLVLFGNDSRRLPLEDVAGMQLALRRLLPGIDVERIFGWDWTSDPFALGTWCVFKPGQMVPFLPELRRREGHLFFASGDSAVAWRGCIDGAIESGYRGAREIDDYLDE
jgi:monoamine oxidase